MSKLLEQLEESRKNWTLTDKDVAEFNKSWALTINTSLNDWDNIKNVHYEELNKTWENYSNIVNDRASKLKATTMDAANKQTDIEVAKSKIKTERSDDTREDLLEVTWDFKDKQEDRYKQVAEITDRQERIANRQANMSAASAWKYGDIFTDGGMANIKNDIISRFGEQILSAEQYELNTNRTIDNDLMNVGLTEITDKDKRDSFKDVLLDKDNAYILNAISVAAEWDKEAIKDVSNFYEAYVKQKADNESKRAWFTEQAAGMENEYQSLDVFGKAQLLQRQTWTITWYGLIADRIPALINKYPNATLAELEWKVAKIAELALTAKQQLPTIIAKSEDDRTQVEKDILKTYWDRGLQEMQNSDRSTSETLAQQAASDKWLIKQWGTLKDYSPEWKKVLEENAENIRLTNEEKRAKIERLKWEQQKAIRDKRLKDEQQQINDNKKKRRDAYRKLADLSITQWFDKDAVKIKRMKDVIDKALPITL